MTTYEIASLASTLGIGLGQIGIVWYGIRAMNRASAARDRATAARDAQATADAQQRDRAMQQRDAQAQRDAQQRDADSRRRHAESMTALRELIARTGPAPATD